MQLDDFWTEGDTGVAILPAAPPPPEQDVTIFDADLGERVPMVPALVVGVDPINQGRRYVMPGVFTIG